ncbi:MAG TPA: PA0069 family radical SAM protein [Cellvibrionaceae bacterium]|nr:PA0069 family radical SAM protein [Cellvibrionaceae bacterium]HMW73392.1 PA0069 family radical SAM protein [Cellvibrionaceae bacterium]HMY38999.1 PA0069 family radical SAM protein [Marinagarivorans sp.]HNG59808.1 PA0069 family radical SAM protein [Cellvibrionaceae bacterium]
MSEHQPQSATTAIKGRGATSQIVGRFETQSSQREDDGWCQDEPTSPLLTQVSAEVAKSILTRNQSPDLPFSVSLNPYRGCEHGCIYCYARPSHAYLGLSPGLDFESRIFAKINAAQLLRQELAQPNYVPAPIAIGVNTDAYQPCEKTWRITEQVLQVLKECRHPCGLITKSALVERDIALLTDMAQDNLVTVAITLTTLDADISRILEPRAASPQRRLKTIGRLAAAGIPVSVSVAPMIPFITEQDLEAVLTASAAAGATGANYTLIRLPWEVKPLFTEWLQAHFPDRAERVMNRIRDSRGGKENDSDFTQRMKGEGIFAQLIQRRFNLCAKRLKLNQGREFTALNGQLFRKPSVVPAKRQLVPGQADLFG